MAVRRFPVTIEPAGVTVWTTEGTTVLDAARAAGVMIPAPCGGRGACGKCAVKVVEGEPVHPDKEEQVGLKLAPKGVRLACRMKATGPMAIRPLVAAPTSATAGELSSDEPLVAGIDLGTTTVAAVVVGKRSGRQLGRAVVPNRQAVYGADVISRVAAGIGGSERELASAASESILDALCGACGSACACLEDVVRIVVAGNSAMTALILQEGVAGLATHPFETSITEARQLPAGWQGTRVLSEALESVVLPPVASFVGGDTSAALLAAGLLRLDRPSLLVDMGTNAEVAALAGGKLFVTSAAAGPALEGMGVTSGGPFGEGSVTAVEVEGSDLHLDVVGGGDPIWLAGSGLISTIAALRRVGHIDASGAMLETGPLSDRFGVSDGIKTVALDGADGNLVLSQTDVRAFQQAKAGVAAAVYMLARAARLKPRKVERLVVTGALGGSSASADLLELGVLPADLEDALEVVDAAALTGAGMLASDLGLIEDVDAATARAEHVDLASDEAFSETFMAALALEPFTLKKGF